MKRIKAVGIIGTGNVGTSMAMMLVKSGLSVIAFKRNSKEAKLYEHLMTAKQGIKVVMKR